MSGPGSVFIRGRNPGAFVRSPASVYPRKAGLGEGLPRGRIFTLGGEADNIVLRK
jgi:hypothetical protein